MTKCFFDVFISQDDNTSTLPRLPTSTFLLILCFMSQFYLIFFFFFFFFLYHPLFYWNLGCIFFLSFLFFGNQTKNEVPMLCNLSVSIQDVASYKKLIKIFFLKFFNWLPSKNLYIPRCIFIPWFCYDRFLHVSFTYFYSTISGLSFN